MSAEHPSFLALDGRHLGLPDAALEAHIAGCARCRGYIQALGQKLTTPAWLEGAQAPAARRPRRPWMALSLAFAAAAVLVVVLPRVRRPGPDDTGVREKGAPLLAVHLKRGPAVVVWDGHTLLREGDRVRLEVHGGKYGFVSVATAGGDAGPAVMYAGPLAATGATLLPMSFRVSGAGDEEVLDIVLGSEPIAPDAHARPRPPADGWRRRLVLPREPRP